MNKYAFKTPETANVAPAETIQAAIDGDRAQDDTALKSNTFVDWEKRKHVEDDKPVTCHEAQEKVLKRFEENSENTAVDNLVIVNHQHSKQLDKNGESADYIVGQDGKSILKRYPDLYVAALATKPIERLTKAAHSLLDHCKPAHVSRYVDTTLTGVKRRVELRIYSTAEGMRAAAMSRMRCEAAQDSTLEETDYSQAEAVTMIHGGLVDERTGVTTYPQSPKPAATIFLNENNLTDEILLHEITHTALGLWRNDCIRDTDSAEDIEFGDNETIAYLVSELYTTIKKHVLS